MNDKWIGGRCKACLSDVWTSSSEMPRSDYHWQCSNPDCSYHKPVGPGNYYTADTGDMETPGWVKSGDDYKPPVIVGASVECPNCRCLRLVPLFESKYSDSIEVLTGLWDSLSQLKQIEVDGDTELLHKLEKRIAEKRMRMELAIRERNVASDR